MEPVLVADGLSFPECVRWRDGEIWFVDATRLRKVDAEGTVHTVAELPVKLVLGLAFLPDGDAVVGDFVGRQLFRVTADGQVSTWQDLSEHFANPTNETVITAGGHAYTGSTGFNIFAGEEPTPSRLAHTTPDGQVRPTGTGVLFPNGLVISPDGQRLYVAESFGKRITVFDIAEDGELVDGRLFADLSDRDADHPDGMSLAPDGSLWYADPMKGVVVRVAEGGEELARVSVPQAHPTSCQVMGEQGDQLLVTATPAMANPEFSFGTEATLWRVDVGG